MKNLLFEIFLLTNKCFLTGLTRLTRFFAFGKIFVADKKEPVNPADPVKKVIENVNIFSSKVLSNKV